MSKNTENAKLVPLFGRNNDMRVKLLVDELRNAFNRRSVPEITIKTTAFQNQYFAKPDSADDNAIHTEWIKFAGVLQNRLASGKAASADAIAIIQANAGSSEPGSEKNFVQALVKRMFKVSDGSKDITGTAALWGSAKSATYQGLNGVLIANGSSELKSLRDAAATADDAVREFGFRYDKYWLRAMLEGHAATAAAPVAPSSFFDDDATPAAGETYFRRGSELFTIDASGKEVRVDAGSPAFASLKVDAKCLGTGFADGKDLSSNDHKCADYLRECLSGKDVTKCKAYLESPNFWADAEKEVEAMLPAMAVQTLNAFEFGMEQVWDNTASRRLLKYKSVDSWLANLTEQAKTTGAVIDDAAVKNIAANTKLIGYLRMLVSKVNSNPAILNKDYSGAVDSARINDPEAFAGSRLHKMGVRGRVAASTLSVSSIDKLSQAIKDSNARVSLSFGLPGLTGFTGRINLMGGGVVEDLEQKASDVTKHTGFIIENQFLALTERLKRHGKAISQADNAKIVALIDSLKKSEEKLYKANLYTEKYAKLLEVHGVKDNTSVLTMDHLKEFVDNRNKYFARVSKKQNDLLSIVRSIAEAVNKETPSPEAEMKKLDVDAKTINFGSLLG